MGELDRQIKDFWNSNPLLSGELAAPPGTLEFFKAFDEIKTGDIFLGNIGHWILPGMKNKKVLDVGCGPGYWSRRLNEVGADYYAVDISSTSVALTKKSMTLFGHRGQVVEASAEKLPFEDKFFDYVVSEGVIHHAANTEACAREIVRVLKPGGVAIVSVYFNNIVLRNPVLFSLMKRFMQVTGFGLKGRRREGMARAESPAEFVRMYDGGENPVGRSYSTSELAAMLTPLEVKETEVYYVPMRVQNNLALRLLRKPLMSALGTMIRITAQKPG